VLAVEMFAVLAVSPIVLLPAAAAAIADDAIARRRRRFKYRPPQTTAATRRPTTIKAVPTFETTRVPEVLFDFSRVVFAVKPLPKFVDIVGSIVGLKTSNAGSVGLVVATDLGDSVTVALVGLFDSSVNGLFATTGAPPFGVKLGRSLAQSDGKIEGTNDGVSLRKLDGTIDGASLIPGIVIDKDIEL
jgi:hypothetical protein